MAMHLLLQVRVGFDHSQEKDFYLFSSGQPAPLHFKHRLVVSPFCSLDPSGFPPHIHVSLPQTIDMLVRLFTDWRFAIGVNVCVFCVGPSPDWIPASCRSLQLFFFTNKYFNVEKVLTHLILPSTYAF